MFDKNTRNGDLPPGIYERMPDGTLVPTKKILTNDPPRPAHVAADGKITNVTKSAFDWLNDEVIKHYETKTGHSLTTHKMTIQKYKDMCNRAADSVMGD